MLRLTCLVSAIVLALSGCSNSNTPTRQNDLVPLTSIEIIAETPSIAAHTSTKLAVKGNYSGELTRDITDQAVWSSNSPALANFITVDSQNRVTGHIPGTAVLTATVGNVTTTFNLTVTSATVTSLTISPAAPSVSKGLTTQFTAKGTFSDATLQDLTFDATWASTAPGVASVSDASSSKGFTRALAVGTASITATFDGVTGTTPLTVTEVLLQSISVSPASASILNLSSRNFQAVGHYSDGTSTDISGQVSWSSSRPEIATIATSGTVKAVAQGTTSISASMNGISSPSSLKVTGGNLTAINLSLANPKLVKGSIVPITARGLFSNGSSRDISRAVDWSVANTNIATVTISGDNQVFLNAREVTTLVAPTKITAKYGLVTADTHLTVTSPQLQSLMISPASLDLNVGTIGHLTSIATFNDGSTQDVTANTIWYSSADTTASVDNTDLDKGRVHGVSPAAGSVNINASYGNITVTAPVTVKARTILNVNINGVLVMISGNQSKFNVTAMYTDSTVKDVTEEATWSIDKSDVAILASGPNQPGQVVAVDAGTATLTAGFDGKTQAVTLIVQQ